MFSISNPSLVHEAASRIASIALKLNPVEIVTPLNQREEKNLWLKSAENGVIRNPIFIYDKTALRGIAGLEHDLLGAASQLERNIIAHDLIDTAILALIKDRVKEAHASIQLARSILMEDDKKSGYFTSVMYGRPNPQQLTEAIMLATSASAKLGDYASRFSKEEAKRLKGIQFDAAGICDYFQRALAYYGIGGWSVEIDEQASSIDVRNKTHDGKPRVVVPVDREVNGLKLLELIGHEIECHLRDSENAAQLFYELIDTDSPLAPLVPVFAKSDNEMLYEGHAKLSDASVTGDKALPKPYYTIAQDYAAKGESFSSTANHILELRQKLGDSESAALKGAWLACYRSYRGCTNTKNPSGYTFGKDYAYLAGFSLARNLQHAEWLDYASLTLSDISQLHSCGVVFSAPAYPYRDAVKHIADGLLGN